jgi:D-amino peptidase
MINGYLVGSLTVPLLMLAFVGLAISPAEAQESQKLKVYISVDMEGIAGVVTGDQLGPGGFEYARFREFTTLEALAAIRAAKSAGATEIVVSDSHGNGENLLIEKFPKDVRIIRSWPRRLSMMAGIDSTFDAVIFIGYHSSTHNTAGVRAHTFSSGRLTRVALNGEPVTEGAFNAAIAGHFGVPVVMMAGDDAAIEEVRSLVGNIEAAETKKSLGFHSANTLTPEASVVLIEQKALSALKRLRDFKPYTIGTPVTLEVGFKNYRPVEVLSYLKGIERTDSHTIRYRCQDMLEVSDFMNFLTNYSFSLEP